VNPLWRPKCLPLPLSSGSKGSPPSWNPGSRPPLPFPLYTTILDSCRICPLSFWEPPDYGSLSLPQDRSSPPLFPSLPRSAQGNRFIFLLLLPPFMCGSIWSPLLPSFFRWGREEWSHFPPHPRLPFFPRPSRRGRILPPLPRKVGVSLSPFFPFIEMWKSRFSFPPPSLFYPTPPPFLSFLPPPTLVCGAQERRLYGDRLPFFLSPGSRATVGPLFLPLRRESKRRLNSSFPSGDFWRHPCVPPPPPPSPGPERWTTSFPPLFFFFFLDIDFDKAEKARLCPILLSIFLNPTLLLLCSFPFFLGVVDRNNGKRSASLRLLFP